MNLGFKKVMIHEDIPPDTKFRKRERVSGSNHLKTLRSNLNESSQKNEEIEAKIDNSPPSYSIKVKYNKFDMWSNEIHDVFVENLRLLNLIKRARMFGKVDCHRRHLPSARPRSFDLRVNFLQRTRRENLALYDRLVSKRCDVKSTASLNRDWKHNRNEIITKAALPFVLFPPVPCECIEHPGFAAPPGVKRPRVYMTIGIHGYAVLGELCIELFNDVCPITCKLFTQLLDGDNHGHSYIGTSFFRKVPGLFWSGGDVIHNNGFGCYMQEGRVHPIGAENYHFSHAMPGLLSMRVTCDNEVCGIFNITFKPLPQFDLQNVVFGRVIRPSNTYNSARVLGKMLSMHPLIEIKSTRRFSHGQWIKGTPNTRLKGQSPV